MTWSTVTWAIAGTLACAGGAGSGDPMNERSSGQTAPSAGQEASSVRTPEGLRIEVSLAAPPIAGRPIDVRLVVSNESDREAVIDFRDGQRYDFEVRSDDRPVWRWASDMFFTQVLGRERIAPGESLRWTARFDAGLPPGSYVLSGTLTAARPVRVELPFDVPG